MYCTCSNSSYLTIIFIYFQFLRWLKYTAELVHYYSFYVLIFPLVHLFSFNYALSHSSPYYHVFHICILCIHFFISSVSPLRNIRLLSFSPPIHAIYGLTFVCGITWRQKINGVLHFVSSRFSALTRPRPCSLDSGVHSLSILDLVYSHRWFFSCICALILYI